MGLLQTYSTVLLRHPGKVLILGTSCVLILFIITLYMRPLQSFNDPLIGFEARGTEISTRTNTWKLLIDETSASANNLSLLPNSPVYDGSYYQNHNNVIHSIHDSSISSNNATTDYEPEPPIIESSIQQTGSNVSVADEPPDKDEEEYYRLVNSTRDTTATRIHHSLGSSRAFCGKIYDGYAQAIVSPSTVYSVHGLFNLHSMLAVCQLDTRLRLEHTQDDGYLFARDCEQLKTDDGDIFVDASTCCNSWSMPNYIACLNNKTSCMHIDVHDLRVTEKLLDLCAPYYYRSPYEECFTTTTQETTQVPPDMDMLSSLTISPRKSCESIPDECRRCGGWTYNVLHYVANEGFAKPRSQPVSQSQEISNKIRHSSRPITLLPRESSAYRLVHTNIFLPIAKSSSLLKYYLALAKHSLKTPYAQVRVLNLGLKNSLFEHLIFDDMKLFITALISILIVISIYTWSTILSLVILLIICLSLCLSYTIYELVLNIAIFPFMNLLAVVISFGICSDNAMLFCKHWNSASERYPDTESRSTTPTTATGQHNPNTTVPANCSPVLSPKEHLDRMLKRAVMSTSVATLATACSFIISAISNVTAVRCFCIFATLSVITNYLLIIILLPPALVLDAKLKDLLVQTLNDKTHKLTRFVHWANVTRARLLHLGDLIHQKWIFFIIIKCKLYLVITFVTIMICSAILVFHGPGMQPADDDDIQLLSKQHAFEQYDKNMKRQFNFERVKDAQSSQQQGQQPPRLLQEVQETLPIRVVFGVKPSDNGDYFDPHNRGSLELDHSFDISEPNSQIWLLEFCQKLRQQRFVLPPLVSDMSNCFMDTFKSWMETRSCQDPINSDIDRAPCCQTSDFPYNQFTFNKCMLEAVSMIRRSPHLYPNTNAGLRFYKNSTRVAASIIEYQSNWMYTNSFTKMEHFYNDIDEWVSWHINNTAPPGLKSGWFVSNNLDLLALQSELESSTTTSVWVEILFAMVALWISTRNLCLTFAGSLTIGTIIVVIFASLILLRWTLGVAESILISLTIGLSIDFALHYTVAYNEGSRSKNGHGVIQRILDEVGSPIALAATTTSLAGFVIIWSDILAYQELGTFLILIALVSWLTSTFFLLSILATIVSIKQYCEQYVKTLFYLEPIVPARVLPHALYRKNIVASDWTLACLAPSQFRRVSPIYVDYMFFTYLPSNMTKSGSLGFEFIFEQLTNLLQITQVHKARLHNNR